MSTVGTAIKDIESLPPFLTSAETRTHILPNLSEGKFYELLNIEGCPKIEFGRKYLIPTIKFIAWLENRAC